MVKLILNCKGFLKFFFSGCSDFSIYRLSIKFLDLLFLKNFWKGFFLFVWGEGGDRDLEITSESKNSYYF